MIGKKVSAGNTPSKQGRIARLTAYIRAPQHDNSREKCIYASARGFVSDTPEGQTAEMVALAQDAVRSKDPINHYVLSWRQGEEPTVAQVEQGVDLFLEELGLPEHQAIYGLHADTDNIHLHLMVNRVDPETGRVTKINRGFDIEAAHRAVARIEHAQGWQPELCARYRVDETGKVVRSSDTRERQPQSEKRDRENQTGLKSAERVAMEKAAPIIEAAGSWAELHRELSKVGMRYERVGSGAKVFVGDVPVKASRVSRGAGFGKLQKRLGPHEVPAHGLRDASSQTDASAQPEPLRPELPGWEAFTAARQAYNADKDAARLRFGRETSRLRSELADAQRVRRDAVMSRSWKGKGPLLNAMRKTLSTEDKRERAGLSSARKDALSALRDQWPKYPGLQKWLRDEGKHVEAEQWRHRDSAAVPIAAPQARPSIASAQVYGRYIAAWESQRDARQAELSRLSASNGRAWWRHRVVSRLRWAACKQMATGRLSRRLWFFYARRADQRDRLRLSQRHKAAVQRARAAMEPPSFEVWIGQQEDSDGVCKGRGGAQRGATETGRGQGGPPGRRRHREPDAAFAPRAQASRAHAGLRKLSEVALVFGKLGHALLLPGDAGRQLGQRRPEADRHLRRGGDRGGLTPPRKSRGRSR